MIRIRREEDIDECVSLLHSVHEQEGYPRGTNDFRRFITHGTQEAWVAELDTNIVGHIAVGEADASDLAVHTWRCLRPENDNIALAKRLFVHPDARGKGVAAALLKHAGAYGRTNDKRLVLFVLIADEAAIRLYRRLRWEEFGTGSFRFGNDFEKNMDAICFASPAGA